MFPASLAVFKSGHDPSTPLGMTAGEKEREAGLGRCDREAEEKSGHGVPCPYAGRIVR